jgi:hypothetical protein
MSWPDREIGPGRGGWRWGKRPSPTACSDTGRADFVPVKWVLGGQRMMLIDRTSAINWIVACRPNS